MGGFTDSLDDAIKQSLYINDEEFDYLCSLGDEVIDAIVSLLPLDGIITFSEKRKLLTTINKALENFK